MQIRAVCSAASLTIPTRGLVDGREHMDRHLQALILKNRDQPRLLLRDEEFDYRHCDLTLLRLHFAIARAPSGVVCRITLEQNQKLMYVKFKLLINYFLLPPFAFATGCFHASPMSPLRELTGLRIPRTSITDVTAITEDHSCPAGSTRVFHHLHEDVNLAGCTALVASCAKRN